MSTSIYGTVEIRDSDPRFADDWYDVINAGLVLSGNYDLFGCLFGVRNTANFRPLFAARGAPPDCRDDLLAEYRDAEYYHGLTWCGYQELLDIDLDELSEAPDSRIVISTETPPGPLVIKRAPSTPEEAALRRRLSRREALQSPDFLELMELMGVLAKYHGAEHVRLVVWFD